ncbi:MAG: DUF2808 domain-containing protein (plasmid) [Leptolyngbya sp. BL-A-14]
MSKTFALFPVKRFGRRFNALLPLACFGFTLSACFVAQAIQLQDGTSSFAAPPTLVATTTTFKAIYSPSTYFFTIQVPATAGEALQRLTLTQETGSEAIAFRTQDCYAYEGTRDREGRQLPAIVTQDAQTKALTAAFSPPLPPGTLVTLSLRPRQNPSISGIYEFQVVAFPTGEKPSGQVLGYGRLQFYSSMGGGAR